MSMPFEGTPEFDALIKKGEERARRDLEGASSVGRDPLEDLVKDERIDDLSTNSGGRVAPEVVRERLDLNETTPKSPSDIARDALQKGRRGEYPKPELDDHADPANVERSEVWIPEVRSILADKKAASDDAQDAEPKKDQPTAEIDNSISGLDIARASLMNARRRKA